MPNANTGPDALVFTLAGTDLVFEYSLGTIPGVIVIFAAGRNGAGAGMLAYLADGTLQYRAPGSDTFGKPVDVSVGGAWIVCDGEDVDKFLRVTVVPAKLPPHAFSAQVLMQVAADNGLGGADVDAAAAAAGQITSWAIGVRNASTKGVHRLLLWIRSGITGYEISPDNATWTAPTSEGTALALGSIAAGATSLFYLRRTIAAGAPANIELPSLFDCSFHSAL